MGEGNIKVLILLSAKAKEANPSRSWNIKHEPLQQPCRATDAKPVLTRKISQQNRSEQGAKTHAALMALFHAAELQGKNPAEAVLSLANKTIGKTVAPVQELDSAMWFFKELKHYAKRERLLFTTFKQL